MRRATSIDREIKKRDYKYSNREEKPNKKERKGLKIFFIICCILGIIGCSVLLFILYGPWNGFRDWLITTAMTTMNHQYFATWFYDESTINDCLNKNKVIEVVGSTNTDEIIIDTEVTEEVTYANEYERQILERDPENNDYKIIKIEGDGFDGVMAVIYDPSRIVLATSNKLGDYGQYLTTMSEQNNALVAINAGGYADENWEGTGGIPAGITIKDGELLSTTPYTNSGGVIGFNRDHKLVLGKFSATQTKNENIRDGASFGPFLIMNGEAASVKGNGGGGLQPRSAIAQRKDGIVLFLAINGRTVKSKGATYGDLIEIFQNYGAWNAANLDGGTSSGLTVHHKLINDPVASSGAHRTRPIATAFMLLSDDSDDGDYSIVKNKID